MKLTLITFSTSQGTFGKWYDNHGKLICHTVEKAWRDNQPGISCIPAGLYDLKPTKSPKFGNTYCLVNEDLDVSLSGDTKRTHILIHVANKPSELLGCIAPVSEFCIMHKEWAGSSSAVACNKLMNLLDGEDHKLLIKRF